MLRVDSHFFNAFLSIHFYFWECFSIEDYIWWSTTRVWPMKTFGFTQMTKGQVQPIWAFLEHIQLNLQKRKDILSKARAPIIKVDDTIREGILYQGEKLISFRTRRIRSDNNPQKESGDPWGRMMQGLNKRLHIRVHRGKKECKDIGLWKTFE